MTNRAGNARLAALTLLADVLDHGHSLAETSGEQALKDPRDRAYARHLAYGVLRWLTALEYLASGLLQRPLKRRDRDIGRLLSIGLFQLWKESGADHAAINEAAECARLLGKSWAVGLVNAVLRRFQREREARLQALARDDARYAHPDWLLERLRADWPDDWPAVVAQNNRPGALWLRLNGRADATLTQRELLDAGYSWDKLTLTYTFWYASGDDDPEDDDFEGYLAVDVDSFDNHILFESLVDDNVFTERHYILDKGFIMNKLRFDYKATDKFKVGAAVMYMMTAEDIEYIDDSGDGQEDDSLGFEIDADMSYTLFKGLTFNFAAGYLFADDAMDFFEEDVDGNGNEDVLRVMSSIRYKF